MTGKDYEAMYDRLRDGHPDLEPTIFADITTTPVSDKDEPSVASAEPEASFPSHWDTNSKSAVGIAELADDYTSTCRIN